MKSGNSKKGMKRIFFVSIALFTLLALTGVTTAADYPKGPITMMIPFSPGGSTDVSGRAIASAIEPILKVAVVCENKTGGGGSVGWMWLSRQKPDGYTIGMATVSVILQQYTGVAGVKVSEFDPISMIAYSPCAISVPANSPFKNVKDLVDYAKKNPGKIRVSNSGTGSIWHLCASALEEAAGVKFTHVPFKGGKPALVAMLGGHVEVSGSSVGEVAEFVKGGKARVLGIMRGERFPLFPDIPTFKEQGYDLQLGPLFGVIAPKGLPQERIKILEAACAKGVQSEKYVEIQNNFGNEIRYLNAEDFSKLIEKEDAFYHKLIQKVGLEKKR
jgi:tripartite-type tricarboxylate transporter receptor subunit TctC